MANGPADPADAHVVGPDLLDAQVVRAVRERPGRDGSASTCEVLPRIRPRGDRVPSGAGRRGEVSVHPEAALTSLAPGS